MTLKTSTPKSYPLGYPKNHSLLFVMIGLMVRVSLEAPPESNLRASINN